MGIASFVGFYLHPHLLPILSESIPAIWEAAQGWLTAPILFLLLNLVVGTLYFSSVKLAGRPEKLPEKPRHTHTASTSVRNDQMPDHDDAAAQVANSSRSSAGLRARIEKAKPFLRLVRSKSEQIPPSVTKAEASGSRLKKADTFEVAAKGSRKPMVIVADPPEDESSEPARPEHEGVDKKAEDFISRFYQKVKLQRLDSLLRNQQQGQQAI